MGKALLAALLGALAAGDDHRAFRPVERPPLPAVKRPGWPRNAIDRFVLARLDRRGLQPSPEADPHSRVRRVSITLTGLTPALEEIERLVGDPSAEAHERMVDRFLASPAYGERWGKHWLDAAGYADSNGYFHADSDRPHAWRYRDWVIGALNRDMPLDEFVRWQLAGDELAGYERGQEITPDVASMLVATHFFRNGPDGTGETDGNPAEQQRDRLVVIEGNVANLGSALLGLAVGCARCHDHPFEPVTQKEYYGLQAIIAAAYPDEGKLWKKPQARTVALASREEIEAHEAKVKALKKKGKKAKGKKPPDLPRIAPLLDLRADPPPHRLKKRGVYTAPGDAADPGVPVALTGPGYPYKVVPSKSSSGRRTALARWITSPRHPLLARVLVNRVWQHHFGTGLVATPGNLGRSGAAPSHPDLLDWLAAELISNDWSLKSIHRLILCSSTFRQSSADRRAAARVDPESRLLWRWPLRRLDAETVRDGMLAASGALDRTMGGRYVPTKRIGGSVVVEPKQPGARRRSVYVQHRRTQVLDFLRTFDAPPIVSNSVRRTVSTVPNQSLALLNSDFARPLRPMVRGADPGR